MGSRSYATFCSRVSSLAACMARVSLRIACIPVSSPHDQSGGLISPLVRLAKFSRYPLLRVQKRLSISLLHQTLPR